MRNKRKKSETISSSESEENGGNVDNGKDETQKTADRNNHNSASETSVNTAMRKSTPKRRSRGSMQQKQSAAHADDGDEVKDELVVTDEQEEQENGEKTAVKPSPSKRKRKEDQKASTSARGEDSGGNDEYEVDMIISHRTIKGRRQFLIRWKGYNSSSDSWENEKDLHCPKLIEEFLANEKDEKEKAKAKLTKTDKSKKTKTKKQTENDEQNIKEVSTDKEGLKEFEVERIIEVHFKKNGKRDFLIRWKGFSAMDDTWEPEENLNCPDLITKFMQKLEKMKTADFRELRTNPAHTKRYTLSTRDSGRRLSRRHKDKQRYFYLIFVLF
ncbi:Chromobox protein-like protein 5 [Harpegnathos saltator]|uniref:Chromobox protein-like protein 5 n=1 Tax=Harpegnathos saltator TaxID=610380 RepID=E2BZ15_HARSA|nr:Chromobox protein-like protein 5 [Harpegnathos saltator]